MERRKLTRVNFKIEALIKYNDEVIMGNVENISLKGIYVCFPENINIEIGQNVYIIIYITGLESKLEIKIEGKLVRKDNSGLGFKFDKYDLDSFIHLRNIVAYNSESYEKIMDEFVEATN